MSDSRNFNKVVISEGYAPLYTGDRSGISQVLDHMRGYAEASVKFEQTKPGTAIPYVGISDDSRVQGFAFSLNNRDFIGITRGTIDVVAALFSHILSFPQVFPGIGTANGMPAPSPWPKLFLDSDDLPALPKFNNQQRELLAGALTTMALDFVIFHEISHIWRGHCRLNKENGANPFIREIVDTDRKSNGFQIQSQAIEVDADALTVGTMLANFDLANQSTSAYVKLMHALEWSTEETLAGWMFAVYSFFRLFADEEFNLDNLESKHHPPPAIRQAWLVQNVAAYCKVGQPPISDERLKKLAQCTLTQAEQAFSLLLNKPQRSIDLFTAQDPRVDIHLARVLAEKAVIEPRLIELGYGVWDTPA